MKFLEIIDGDFQLINFCVFVEKNIVYMLNILFYYGVLGFVFKEVFEQLFEMGFVKCLKNLVGEFVYDIVVKFQLL